MIRVPSIDLHPYRFVFQLVYHKVSFAADLDALLGEEPRLAFPLTLLRSTSVIAQVRDSHPGFVLLLSLFVRAASFAFPPNPSVCR